MKNGRSDRSLTVAAPNALEIAIGRFRAPLRFDPPERPGCNQGQKRRQGIMRGLAALFLVACLIALATIILTAATASLTACILLTSIPVALR